MVSCQVSFMNFSFILNIVCNDVPSDILFLSKFCPFLLPILPGQKMANLLS